MPDLTPTQVHLAFVTQARFMSLSEREINDHVLFLKTLFAFGPRFTFQRADHVM